MNTMNMVWKLFKNWFVCEKKLFVKSPFCDLWHVRTHGPRVLEHTGLRKWENNKERQILNFFGTKHLCKTQSPLHTSMGEKSQGIIFALVQNNVQKTEKTEGVMNNPQRLK